MAIQHPQGGTSWGRREIVALKRSRPEKFYSGLDRRGGNFGDGFRVIRRLQRGGSAQAVGHVVLTPEFAAEASAYRFHPALLDGCFQVMIAALRSDEDDVAPYLPIEIGRFALYGRPGNSCWSHAVVQPGTRDLIKADVRVFDNNGTLLLSCDRYSSSGSDATLSIGWASAGSTSVYSKRNGR